MTFAVYGNEKKDAGLVVTSETAKALLNRGASVVLPASCKPLLGEAFPASPAIRYADDDTLYDDCDYAVVIGGDGTILKAAGRLYGKNTPIIGVNLGKVGYLTSLEPGDYGRLDGLLHGDTSTYTVEERLMLAFSIEREGTVIREGIALNDVVIAKGDISHMIDVDLACAGRVIANYRCDGLIVSTPTGSTAYSMSAGGAILDPSLDCISLIPCCPYLCINSSPIIFSGHTVLDVTYRKTRKGQAYVNADGTDCFELCHNDVVHLAAAEHRTRLIRFDKTDFYELLNKKLSASILEQTMPGFGGNNSEDISL